MADDTVSNLLRLHQSLESMRLPHEGYWDELGRVCIPRTGSLANSRVPQTAATPDRRSIAENFDGTAQRACNILATGQSSRITPSGSRWFVLRPAPHLQGNRSAEAWFSRCTDILASAIAASSFYNKAFNCYLNRGAYGVSAMEILPGPNNRGLHFRSLPVGTFAIGESAYEEVDTLSRVAHRTPAQLAQEFGRDNIPESVAKKFDEPSTRHQPTEQVIHIILPRDPAAIDPRKTDAKNKPFASYHIHRQTETLLLESGYDSFPTPVSRWQAHDLSPYGWGPGDYALPEASQANFLEQINDLQAELAVSPRILYPAGMKDEIDFGPYGLTSFDPAAGENAVPREWLTGGRFEISKDRAADKKRAIDDAFFVELFRAVSQLPSDATATQVNAIVSESREMFHPIYSNMVREFHIPTLRRSFQIGLAQGIFPPPPPSVIESDTFTRFIADPEVEFTSAMAMALEAGHLAKTNDLITVLSPLAALDPAWLRAFDPETIVPHLTRTQGLPLTFLRTPEQMRALAEAAAQQEQAMAATQAVRNLGGVDQAAKAAAMLQ
jgi:hypothetical protein